MSDMENLSPDLRLTDEQVGAAITEMMDGIAEIPDGMVASKNLLALIAAHANADGELDVPLTVLQLEVVRSVGVLEARILAIEDALRDAGISVRDISAATEAMYGKR